MNFCELMYNKFRKNKVKSLIKHEILQQRDTTTIYLKIEKKFFMHSNYVLRTLVECIKELKLPEVISYSMKRGIMTYRFDGHNYFVIRLRCRKNEAALC